LFYCANHYRVLSTILFAQMPPYPTGIETKV
jgi:hypothetical protein